MKLVHAADLHLDSPLRGLERYEGAPAEQIRGATRRALANLVDLCLEEQADALLIAGDLYDGDWKDYSTALFFAAQMARLREADVPVYLVRGNHDARSEITKHLRLPSNVRGLSTRGPETVRDDRLGLAVHGQGFASRAVSDDLAAAYPDAVAGYFNVGLLHTSLDGREGHDTYAPTTRDVLASKGYDYWALGHVHAREVVARDPWIVFSGNLQGRHARETGAKGASVVDVRDGRVIGVEHRALDVVRWARVEVDAAEAASPDDVVDMVRRALEEACDAADERLLAARVFVRGHTDAHEALEQDRERWEQAIRGQAIDVGGDALWVEKVKIRTAGRLDPIELSSRDDAVGELLRTLHALRDGDDDALIATLHPELARLKLPPEAREGDDALRFDRAEVLREALEDVERMLLARLSAEGGGTP